MIQIQLSNVGHIIQLAVAPVFLLTGVGTNLTVLTNRLARIIDRSRVVQERMRVSGEDPDSIQEIDVLFRRSYLINRAITLSTCCALLICMVVAMLFVGDALDVQLNGLIAGLFIAAMLSLIGSFVFLLREIFVATDTMAMRSVMDHHRGRRRATDKA
ncbi:MAG: DUF2721 domain-containing protein [Burkholderiaceae bacterium]